MVQIRDRTSELDYRGLRNNSARYIVLHSTRSYPEFEDVLGLHKFERNWAGVGYHLFMGESGIISQGRPYNLEGAHAIGFNLDSIGICIYSSDGNLDQEKIERGRHLIASVRRELGDLELISHTQAQIRYNNKLLRENGLEIQFEDRVDVVESEKFDELKGQMDRLVGELDTQRYSHLKRAIKGFKNCPGELFREFV